MAGEKADAVATWSIDLEDNTSGTAESAVEALAKLKRGIEADTRELAAMQKAMRNLQQGSSVNIAQFRELKARIDAKKASIAQAQSAALSLGETFKGTRRSGKSFSDALAELNKTATAMPGPMGGVIGRLSTIKGLLAGGVVAFGIAAIAAALVALTVAAAAATVALLKYGIAQAGARRSELLRLEGLTKMRNWWGIAAGNAGEMQAAIDKVSGSTALGRDKLTEYTGELYRMGLRGQNLALALEAAAIKGSVLGDEGAKSAMHWAAGMALAGGSVKKLTDDIRARFGGVAARQLLDLNVQSEKLRENFGRLFGDLKIEALLKGVSAVTELFSQATRSGRALKAIVETVFQPMLDQLAALTPLVRRFFQGVTISALLIAIALVRVRNWFRKTFGDSEILKGMDLQRLALFAGVAAVAAFGGALVLAFGLAVGAIALAMPFIWGAVAAVGALVVEGLLLAAPWIALAAAMGLAFFAGYKLVKWALSVDWSALGRSLVEGIVRGVKGATKWLIDTVKGLGSSAMAAFKQTLGISSPSKAFMRLGLEIPRGIESGIATGTPRARNAAAGIIDAPSIPAPADAPRSTDRGRAPPSAPTTIRVDVGGIQITAAGATARELGQNLEQEIARVFEVVAIQLGAQLPRAT